MPYHKDKQQAFQAAVQGVHQAEQAQHELVLDGASAAEQLSHLQQEINEAYQQIDNALEVASEHQRGQLEQYKKDLDAILGKNNNTM